MKRTATALATAFALTAGLAAGALAQDEGTPLEITNLTVVEEGAGWNETFGEITDLFAETHPGASYVIEYSPQEQHSQKVQLVAAQGALPFMYTAPELDVIAELDERGEVLDLEPVLEELGVLDRITPAAQAAVKTFFNGKLQTLPLQMNIEGVWYNKDIFADLGLEPPTTWDEFLSVGAALQDAGIQPLAASGIRAWPITRLISGYIFRSLGPDALVKVDNGEASLTDPGYVAAAQAIADLGAAGFFGPGVSDLDYGPAEDLFLQGDAGMFYMGSWAVADFTDPERNLIGEDAIGFFPFPAVEGGAGDATQTPMNLGATTLYNASLLDDDAKQWLKTVVENYGDIALRNQGQVTGFVLNETPDDLPPLTKLVADEIAKTSTSVTWFEQLFTAKELDAAWRGVVPLVTGQMSAQDYMQSIVDAAE